MRLGFDATAVRPGGKGIARVQAELLAEFARSALVPGLTVFVGPDAARMLLPPVATWRYEIVRTQPLLRFEQFVLPRAARAAELDVVLTTSDRAPLWGPSRVVFIYEHPRHRAQRGRQAGDSARQRAIDTLTRALFPLSLRRASAVVAASKATAGDLPGSGDARVVYSGVAERFRPDAAGTARGRTLANAPAGYFLQLASDDPRENAETVLDAYRRTGLQVPLVIAGAARATLPRLRQLAEALGIDQQVRWLGFVSDDDLVDLYRGAMAYVDTSLHEGFGLQVLEAMACGAPVIASDRWSLPEVVGDAGVLVDPEDADAVSARMRSVASDESLRTDLSRRGRERAAGFSWERTARELLDVCREVARPGVSAGRS